MKDDKIVGVVYILTNPSFPEYIKIGYAEDLEKRLRQLNRSECVPYAFRAYATYDVTEPLQDTALHDIIDGLNPDLRAIENFDGKNRKKEFYALSAEEAYALLERIAKFSNTQYRLHRMTPEGHEELDEKVAEEIREEAKERRTPFSFIKCGIAFGEKIELQNHPECVAIVKDDRHVEYEGLPYSLSILASKLLGIEHALQGPIYWTYNGRLLDDIRKEREERGLYK